MRNLSLQRLSGLLLGALFLAGLYFSKLYNYLLFHSVAEIFSIIIACGVFMIVWNSRKYFKNDYFLFLGVSFLFIAGIDFAHALAYKGMNIFTGFGANLATQLWIIARYMQAISLLIAFVFIKRKIQRPAAVFALYLAITALLFGSVFYWKIFPVCYIDGVGLTLFKKISEYIISFLFAVSILFLFLKRSEFNKKVFKFLILSIVVSIISEIFFTLYVGVYDLPNFAGHILKIFVFYFIYKAIIEIGVSWPQEIVLRALNKSEKQFEAVNESVADAIISMDNSNNIILWNRAAENIFGYKKEEIMGKPFILLIPKQSQKLYKESVAAFISSNAPAIGAKIVEIMGLKKSGKTFPADISISTWIFEENKFLTAVIRDITARKELEKKKEEQAKELDKKIKELELANDLMVGRELKMLELKKEIQKLKK